MRYSEIMGQEFDKNINNEYDVYSELENRYTESDTELDMTSEMKAKIPSEDLNHNLHRETIVQERSKICPGYRIHILVSFMSISLPTIYIYSLINDTISLTNHNIVNYLIITFSVVNIFVMIGFTIVLNMLNCGLIWNIELDKEMPTKINKWYEYITTNENTLYRDLTIIYLFTGTISLVMSLVFFVDKNIHDEVFNDLPILFVLMILYGMPAGLIMIIILIILVIVCLIVSASYLKKVCIYIYCKDTNDVIICNYTDNTFEMDTKHLQQIQKQQPTGNEFNTEFISELEFHNMRSDV